MSRRPGPSAALRDASEGNEGGGRRLAETARKQVIPAQSDGALDTTEPRAVGTQ